MTAAFWSSFRSAPCTFSVFFTGRDLFLCRTTRPMSISRMTMMAAPMAIPVPRLLDSCASLVITEEKERNEGILLFACYVQKCHINAFKSSRNLTLFFLLTFTPWLISAPSARLHALSQVRSHSIVVGYAMVLCVASVDRGIVDDNHAAKLNRWWSFAVHSCE